ncbi:MAG: sigma-70 family RNA polymerase sigma factor [Rhodothermales bacterium]|nr:sigma-70 family RNA polymerase sigma factor [Rhodothermales bacterium]
MKVREFERLVRESQDRLYGYAIHFLANREEAEDVVQDAYLRLWKNRRLIRPDGGLAWLISVTRNLCMDKLRRRKVRSVVDVDSDRLAEHAGYDRGPDEHAASVVFENLLQSAMQTLPEVQRSIVILREVTGLSYNEISEALDLPLSTVKVYLHRGRRHLRRRLSTVIGSEAV